MSKIKLCGLTRVCDIEVANELQPEYVGFVFWDKSKRKLTPEQAVALKKLLNPEIKVVGVFVDEKPEAVAELINKNIIDIAQLHGNEDEDYIKNLRNLAPAPVIKAFKVQSTADLNAAEKSSAEYVLLDSGMGTGNTFDWSLINEIDRPFFLAGGLDTNNIIDALTHIQPFAVDVSSGIETNGLKDKEKMIAFVNSVRNF